MVDEVITHPVNIILGGKYVLVLLVAIKIKNKKMYKDKLNKAGNVMSHELEQNPVLVGFSYCWENRIAENLGIPITALSTAEDLISYGKSIRALSSHHEKLIREYIAGEENRLATRGVHYV